MTIPRDPATHFLFIVASAAGLYGAICLWLACFKPLTTITRVGLISGIASMISVLGFNVANYDDFKTAIWMLVAFGPIICAAYLLLKNRKN